MSSVATVRAASRHVFFTAETHAAVSAVAASHENRHPIHKHCWSRRKRIPKLSSELRQWRGDDVDPASLLVKLDRAFDQRENGPVAADAHVLPRAPLRAHLAADDASGLGGLTTIQLDAEHLRIRVATVTTGSLPLLVSHRVTFLRFLACHVWRLNRIHSDRFVTPTPKRGIVAGNSPPRQGKFKPGFHACRLSRH